MVCLLGVIPYSLTLATLNSFFKVLFTFSRSVLLSNVLTTSPVLQKMLVFSGDKDLPSSNNIHIWKKTCVHTRQGVIMYIQNYTFKITRK